MNKTEFIAAVAAKADLTKVDSKKAFDAMVEVIREEMEKGERLSLIGFGTFYVSERAARTGVNPRVPGKKIQIPASKSVKFKAGAGLSLKK